MAAQDDPTGFLRVVVSTLPRDINLNVGVDAEKFVQTFREAVEALGNEPPMVARQKRMMKVIDVIEAEVIDATDPERH